jgi:hypothetical protein
MKQIKLMKSLAAEITVPAGETTGEVTFNFVDRKIIDINLADVISSAISMEAMIEDIITVILFKGNPDQNLFKEYFLNQDSVTLHVKERALNKILHAKKIYEDDKKRKELITNIGWVKKVRNRFAHGRVKVKSDGFYLEYYDDGLKSQKLDDVYWNEVEEKFVITFTQLDELFKKLITPKEGND